MRRRRNSPSSAIDDQGPDAVHVPLDDVPAEPGVDAQGPFQVDRPAGRQPRPGRSPAGSPGDTSITTCGPSRRVTVRQTPLVDRLSPRRQLRAERGVEFEHGAVGLAGDARAPCRWLQ